MRLRTTLLLASFVLLSSCYYDVAEELYPGCDTSEVTYSNDVLTILETSCLGCHNSVTSSGGVDLDGYDKVKTQVGNDRLLGSIKHDKGYSAMPKGSPQLDDCSIRKIEAWINNGAPND